MFSERQQQIITALGAMGIPAVQVHLGDPSGEWDGYINDPEAGPVPFLRTSDGAWMVDNPGRATEPIRGDDLQRLLTLWRRSQ